MTKMRDSLLAIQSLANSLEEELHCQRDILNDDEWGSLSDLRKEFWAWQDTLDRLFVEEDDARNK